VYHYDTNIEMNFPNKKYNIIYADPPWSYGDKLKHHGGSADSHYDTMSIDDICNLPVDNISADNCALFLWGTWPLLPEALRVVESWGFTYKTCGFVWVKNYTNGKKVLGMGNDTRGNTEFVLLAKKGRMIRIDNGISQYIESPIKEHSKKPDQVRQKIVQLYGDLPRIELFARTKIHGWDVFGNDEKLQSSPLEDFMPQTLNSNGVENI